MKLSRSTWFTIGGVGLVVLAGLWSISTANSLVQLDETVQQHLSQVDNVYQRRMDLIPNLVKTVERFAKQEKDVFVGVAQARAQVGQLKPQNPADLQKYAQAQGELSNALSRLLIVVEKYPALKSDANFRDLQAQLEGTENRITTERMRLNEATQAYNTAIRVFPSSLIASFRGFKNRPYFEAASAARSAPEVHFEQ